MIDEEKTFQEYGYISNSLTRGSGKMVIVTCDECGYTRPVIYYNYIKQEINGRCKSCAAASSITRKKHSEACSGEKNPNFGKTPSKETRKKLSKATSGKNNPMFGKIHNKETKKRMSQANSNISKKTHKKMSIANTGENNPMFGRTGINSPHYGKHHSKETRRQMSATKQGITYDEWESYATNSQYCPKFNESCRESNRKKYNRQCFICGCDESKNITSTGKQQKLSVHHIDMNKAQGCDGYGWKLIPVCIYCHNKLHTKRMQSYIEYILKE